MKGERFEHGRRAGQIVSALILLLLTGTTLVLAVQAMWAAALVSALFAAPFAALVWRSRRVGIWVHGDTVTVVKLIGSQTVPATDIDRVERVDFADQGIIGGHVGLVTADGQTITVDTVVWPEEGQPGHREFAETLAGLQAALDEARRTQH